MRGLLFQSTLLQEERRQYSIVKYCLFNFNPRSYKRSDGLFLHSSVYSFIFQSTLLQEERPETRTIHRIELLISIHAPTRGATAFCSFVNIIIHISIHAPTRGATQCVYQSVLLPVISIHAPTRGATIALVFMWWGVRISIHAPTRGATCQHRHREHGD